MIRASGWLRRFRWVWVAIGLALLAWSGLVARQVSIGGSSLDYFPTQDEGIRSLVEMNQHFGSFETLMVGVEDTQGPLRSEALTRLQAMTEGLAELKSLGVKHVLSFANVSTMQESEGGTLNALPFLNVLPKDEAERKELEARTKANTQVYGSLIGPELNAYLILLTIDPAKDPLALVAGVNEVLAREGGSLRLHPFGEAFVGPYVQERMAESMTILGPIMGLLLLLGLWLATRRVGLSLLVFVASALAAPIWLGLHRLADLPLTLAHLPALLPVWLAAFLWFGRSAGAALQAKAERRDVSLLDASGFIAILATLGASALAWKVVSSPVWIALTQTLTVGFAAVLLAGLVVFAPLFAFYLAREDNRSVALPVRAFQALSRPMAPRRRPGALSALMIALGLVLLAVVGAARLHLCLLPEEMFLENEQPAQAVDFFDRLFGGFHVAQIEAQGDFRDPRNARAFLEATEAVKAAAVSGDVHGFGEALTFLNHRMNGVARIPESEEQLKNLWFFFEGRPELTNLIDDERGRAVIVARIKPHGVARDFRAKAEVEKTLNERLAALFDKPQEREPLARLERRLIEQMKAAGKTDAFAALVNGALPRPDEQGCFKENCAVKTSAKEAAVQAITAYLRSDSSPMEVPDTELPLLDAALAVGTSWSDEARTKALAEALFALPSFKAEEIPEDLAGDVARALVEKAQAAHWKALAETGAADLATRLALSTPREEFITGILYDYHAEVAGAPLPAETLRFRSDGFPLRRATMDALLMDDAHKALGLLALAVFLALLLGFGGGLPVAASLLGAALPVALCALVLGFGSLGLDPASASLWAASPLLASLLVPTGSYPHGYGASMLRGLGLTLAFVFTALAFSFTGPVTRLALTAALLLGLGALGNLLYQIILARARNK